VVGKCLHLFFRVFPILYGATPVTHGRARSPKIDYVQLLTIAGCVALFSAGQAAAQSPPPPLEAEPPVGAGTTINGAVPPTLVPSGTVVTVTGNVVPALSAVGDTGGVGNTITVTGGGGIVASNLAGRGVGVITSLDGGFIDLGTGSIISAEGSGSAANIIGATGLFARTLGAGSLVPTITGRDVTISAFSDKPYGAYASEDGLINLSGLTTIGAF
jgi:autotransporter family porin